MNESHLEENFKNRLNTYLETSTQQAEVKHQIKLSELYEEASEIDSDKVNKGREILNSFNF